MSVIDWETVHASVPSAVSPTTKCSMATDGDVSSHERRRATLICFWTVLSTKGDAGPSLAEGIDQMESGYDGDGEVVLVTSICSCPLIDPSHICHFLAHGMASICPPGDGRATFASAEIVTDEEIGGRVVVIPGRVLTVGLYHEHGRLALSVEWHLTPTLGCALRLLAYELPWLLSLPRATTLVRGRKQREYMVSHLFLSQLHLLGLQQLLGHTCSTGLGAQTQLPELFAKGGGFFLEEAGELDLELLDVWLQEVRCYPQKDIRLD